MKTKIRMEQIYNTSYALFRTKGYDEVKIDEICAAAGISKPTLYAYSLTKRDLFIHMYQPCREKTFIAQQSCDLNNLMEEIFRFVDLVADRFFFFGPDLLRDLLRLHLESPALDKILDQEWESNLTGLIHSAQIRRQITNTEDPYILARMIMACIIGYSFQFAMRQAEESRENLHQSVEALLLTEQTSEY